MASAVAKRSDHRASRSASWSVMHSDEELARILQMQEEKEYHDHLAAKELQCQSDHRLARFMSEHDDRFEGRTNVDEFRETANRSSSNSAGLANIKNKTVISISDSDPEFSECFEDTTFDELAGVLERAQNEAEQLIEQQEVADTRTRNEEISEVLQNDEQMNGILENEGEFAESNGEFGDTSFDPIVISPSSPGNSVSRSTSSDLLNHRGNPTEFSPISIEASGSDDWSNESDLGASLETSSANNSVLMSVNVAWNVVGSAVNWVSGFFSGVQSPQQSVTIAAGDAEEDDGEDEDDDDDEGWITDEDSEQFDDDDDDVGTYDDMDLDTDDTDVEASIDFGDDLGSGLVQEEIDVLPTRTYQSRLLQVTTATNAGDAGASANEHQCQSECQVCLGSFMDGEVLRTLPCCHQFHSNCIDIWIQRNAICPVCRVRIRDEIGY